MSRLDDLIAIQREVTEEIHRERLALARERNLRIRAAATMTRGSWSTRVFYAACEHFGITPEKALDGSRDRTCVNARHVAMWLMRDAGRSYPEIGKEIGMDHTSVMSGVRRVESKPLLLETAQEIRAALTGEEAA
jgi:chromosomal replication initiation ATPase DnaA